MNADGIKTVLRLGMQTRETPVDHWRFNLSNNPYCPASKPGDHGLGGNAGMWTSSLICPAWSEWLSYVRDAVDDEREKQRWMGRLCIHEVKEGLNIIVIDSLQDWETLVKTFPDNRSPNPAIPKTEMHSTSSRKEPHLCWHSRTLLDECRAPWLGEFPVPEFPLIHHLHLPTPLARETESYPPVCPSRT
jgi:hypothetical protein